MYSSTCSIQLTCHIFIFFIRGFHSSILHKLKNTLNCWLKLSKHNYLIYKNKQYKSCKFKLVKHNLQKIVNIVKCTECSRNLEFENELIKIYHAKSPSRKVILHFEEKETVKAMSNGGYIWICFGFCGVVVHFLGNGR